MRCQIRYSALIVQADARLKLFMILRLSVPRRVLVAKMGGLQRVKPMVSLLSGLLQTERQSNGRRKLLRELIVEVDGYNVVMPIGFDTDFSTIPWFGRSLVSWSKVDVAGVVHDRLYATGELPRYKADKAWRLVALAGDSHANIFQAYVGWLCLRAFGWVAWYNKRGKHDHRREHGIY